MDTGSTVVSVYYISSVIRNGTTKLHIIVEHQMLPGPMNRPLEKPGTFIPGTGCGSHMADEFVPHPP